MSVRTDTHNSSSMMILTVLAATLALSSALPFVHRADQPSLRPEEYVVSGNPAAEGAYKYQISLRRCRTTGCRHTCGGSLLSKDWVLTAAHCVRDSTPSDFEIHAGTNKRTVGGVQAKVSEIITHPKYRHDGSQGFPNDVALLRLASPIAIDNVKTAAAKLPASESVDYVGSNCFISGWGRNDQETNNLPENLLEASVQAISNDFCQLYVGEDSVGPYHQCIKDLEDKQGACNGDSGGPLSCDNGDGKEVAGVASWVIGNCYTEFPSAYAKVAYFRTWIRLQTGL